MKPHAELIPSGSQTVGPYYRIGLDYLTERTARLEPGSPGVVEIRGQVLDRDGVPVPDALLEFWSGDASPPDALPVAGIDPFPRGFHRVATDSDGRFSVAVLKPDPAPLADGRMQAPHMLVLVFARGLLRNLITRVYFGDESANASDPVLHTIPVERRGTLVACPSAADAFVFEWNVILQGEKETVFFAW